jgi:hypothetical protein
MVSLSPITRGLRDGERVRKDRRDWTRGRPSPKDEASYLNYTLLPFGIPQRAAWVVSLTAA